jgi:hypothetical protein
VSTRHLKVFSQAFVTRSLQGFYKVFARHSQGFEKLLFSHRASTMFVYKVFWKAFTMLFVGMLLFLTRMLQDAYNTLTRFLQGC